MRLKNLYIQLIEQRKHEIKGWHHAYRDFYQQVEHRRERIKAGESLSEKDEPFLKQLLYDKSNGIAARGQSVLSVAHFQLFIKNPEFIAALEQCILLPNQEHFKQFEAVWSDQEKSNNPLLVNRVAAACTLDVSTTVDFGKFKQVFDWLIQEGLIPPYPAHREQDWFSKNVFVMSVIKEEFKDALRNNKTDAFYLSQFIWALYENLSNPFSLKKQVVKYGPPGTGKTYYARQQTALWFDGWKAAFAPKTDLTHDSQTELIQFHPSFSYEDFIEGLRPVLDHKGAAQLSLQNGVFKAFCCSAAQWEIAVYNLEEGTYLADKDWEDITLDQLHPYREQLSALSAECWSSIFAIEDTSKRIADVVPPFFFIIDEINRAELSRVFGELMYCLEYRGVQGRVKTQYAHLNNEQTGMLKTKQGYQFFIPANLYLIGTMNTIDRSIESFDFALRRRFFWEEVMPDIRLLKYHLHQWHKAWEPLADDLDRLNQQITKEPLLGHDYQIGHAYLMNLKYASSLTLTEVRQRLWEDCIRPLLQEYLRGTGKEAELIGSAEQVGHFKKTFGFK